MKRFEVHLIGEDMWKEVMAESYTITDTDPKEIHFQASRPHTVYYLHALRQPVTELPARANLVPAQQH
jgi:hypothetical protein